MAIILANNANGHLASSITEADTLIPLRTGQGAQFPNPTGGNFFPVTLVRADGQLEICYCTARSGDVLTVTRARENTTEKTFSSGDRVSLRLTTGVMQTIFDVVNPITPFAKTLLDDANASTARATLGAQASDATLTALAGVTTAANKLIYATAPDVFTTTSITPFARTLIDDVDAAAMRDTLGLTDVVLRDELSASNGVDLVGGALKQSDLVLQPITKIASYNNANVTQAWKDSVATFGYVYFPGFSSALATYNIVGDDPLLHGTTVFVDDNVNLAFDYDYYPLIGSLDIHGRCKFSFTSKNFSTKGGNVDYVSRNARLNRFPLKASVVAFSDCKQWSINSDTWTQGSLGSSSASAIQVPLTTGITSGLFVPIDIGETISAHLRMETGTATSLGVMLRCANGWIKLHRAPNSPGSWTYQVKQVGQSVVTGSAIPAPSNTLNSYSAGKASIGVSLTSRQTFRLVINGVAGYFPIGSLVGDIYEIGFFADGASSGAMARVTGLCSYKTEDNKAHGTAPINLAIYGDSTAEKWLSTFDMYLPQVIDGEMSSRSLTIQNFAVAGETFAQQFARLKANGPGQASIICMVAGTNEGQAGVSADAFAVQVQQFIDYCNANSRTPMLVEPWMWYSKTFIGGAGQASSNYDGVSELREAGKRVAIAGGAIYVSTTHELPAPLPEYFNSGLDPLLRDDIHQSELGYMLYAELIGSHIVEYLSRVDLSARNIPMYWVNPVVVTAIGADSMISKNRLVASFAVNAFTNGAVVVRLPRGCRPDRSMTFTASFAVTGGTYAACKAVYLNGQITVDGLTQVNSTIYIDASW